MEVCGNYRW